MQSRQIKIMASFIAEESKLKKTDKGRENYLARMETMMEMCGANVHEYREELEKRMPQMQMKF